MILRANKVAIDPSPSAAPEPTPEQQWRKFKLYRRAWVLAMLGFPLTFVVPLVTGFDESAAIALVVTTTMFCWGTALLMYMRMTARRCPECNRRFVSRNLLF